MDDKQRKLLIGAGGAAALTAAVAVAVFLPRPPAPEAPPSTEEARPGAPYEICLKSGWRPVEGMARDCLAPSQIAALADGAVLDDDGARVSLSLSDPADAAGAPASVDTCADYRRLTDNGWYALTTRDMRREGFFVRACGTLSLLEAARAPTVSHFENEELSEEDVRALVEGGRFRIGPVSEGGLFIEGDDLGIARDGPNWILQGGGQRLRVQEIAHADFNGDGRGDVLVFVAMAAERGTAVASAVGIVDKPAAGGPAVFIDRASLQ